MRARLAVDLAGSGPPLVLLHGLATDRHIWDTVLPALTARHRVATVDLPGFGGSAPTGAGYELADVADRIARGLAGRGFTGPFDLVGHSLGGGIALTLAAARPRTVRRLVLVAPAGFRPMPATLATVIAATADAVLAARRSAAPLTDLRWGRRLLLGAAAADGGALAPTLARRMVEASASARRTGPALATITVADLRPLLERAPASLGVIWGENDLTVPVGTLQSITATRRDVEAIVLRNTGHVPMVERPEAFATALERLLGGRHDNATTSSEGRTTFM